jgi:hypothetical protein
MQRSAQVGAAAVRPEPPAQKPAILPVRSQRLAQAFQPLGLASVY